MNGKQKFHKPNGPAFNCWEQWHAADGSGRVVEIDVVTKFGDGKFDYDVTYTDIGTGETHTKDAWNFQVKYFHAADKSL